jgi:hypothetical protein
MVAPDKIDFVKLKETVKEFNELALIEEKLKVIGVSKEVLAQSFGSAVDALSEEAAGKLTTNLIEQYNFLFGDEAPAPEPEVKADVSPGAKPAKEPKPPKAAKPGKEPKPVKEPKPPKAPKERKPSSIEKGIFGSVKGSLSNTMDELVAAGTTIAEMVEKAGVSQSRASNHVKFIEANRGVKITRTKEKVGEGEAAVEVERIVGTKETPAAPAPADPAPAE